MFQLNGNPILIDREQVIGGIRYPHLRDPALREQLGVVEVADPEQYDQRFYWGVGNPKLLNDRLEVKEDGTPLYVQVYNPATEEMEDTTEQMVTKGLKSQWIGEIKNTAGKMLAQTDWMVIRKAERNVDIPATVVANRTAIVAECDRLEAAITACATVEELITVVGNQGWPNDRI
jgi:hypothetical protein